MTKKGFFDEGMKKARKLEKLDNEIEKYQNLLVKKIIQMIKDENKKKTSEL